ncbi:unnamed protein product [Urochloa humidicola]
METSDLGSMGRASGGGFGGRGLGRCCTDGISWPPGWLASGAEAERAGTGQLVVHGRAPLLARVHTAGQLKCGGGTGASMTTWVPGYARQALLCLLPRCRFALTTKELQEGVDVLAKSVSVQLEMVDALGKADGMQWHGGLLF